MVLRPLVDAARQGARLFLVMASLNALFIVLGLALWPSTTGPGSPPAHAGPPSFPYAGYQLLLHAVTGFAVGAVSLDPAVALIGGVVGPLIDFDHIGFFAGLPVEARVGHSLVLVALIILVDSRAHFWGRGTRNLLLFLALEYSVHFAVAPPGFPLFTPLSFVIVDFPRVVPAALAVVFGVGFFFDTMGSRLRSPS